MEKKTQKITESLLSQLEITPKILTVSTDDNNIVNIDLQLDDADTGILIGYHGKSIAALQLILGILLYKQTKIWTRVIVNIGDYRQKRQESLETMAQNTAQKVKFSGEPIALFNLNPFERRIIHDYLSKNKWVVTESEGEGNNRHLIIKPKNDLSAQPPQEDILEEPTPAEENEH